jgi:hypothetical protein
MKGTKFYIIVFDWMSVPPALRTCRTSIRFIYESYCPLDHEVCFRSWIRAGQVKVAGAENIKRFFICSRSHDFVQTMTWFFSIISLFKSETVWSKFSFAMQEVQLQSIDKYSGFECVNIDGAEKVDGFCKTREFIHSDINNHE